MAHQSGITADAAFRLAVDLALPGKGITAIFGASGSGKTTLLRCLAGLQSIDSGRVVVNGETWHDEETFLPTHQRGLGFVFQEASLFEHLTAGDNLNYAIKRAPQAGATVNKEQIVELMGITTLLGRLPAQLSGGERQRVAIARALLTNPRLLLMDEPLAALDHKRRQEILPYLERLHQEVSLPILYVTHSLEEVTRLADHLVLLDEGLVVAQGEVGDLLSRPDLNLGSGVETGSMLTGEIVQRDERWHLVKVRFDGGELWVRDHDHFYQQAAVPTVRVRVLARDVSLSLTEEDHSSILNRLPAQVAGIADDGDPAMATVQLQLGSSRLLARVSRRSIDELSIRPGQKLWAQIKSVAVLR
ncbi:MAG: molybdenum ABC transporter ATP-binding protein [Gammaproteobacteria bacterium]